MNNLFDSIKHFLWGWGNQNSSLTRFQILLLILAGPVLIFFGFFISILGKDYLLYGTNFIDYLKNPPTVLASGLLGGPIINNPLSNLETQLMATGILLSDNPNTRLTLRSSLQTDPATKAFAEELLKIANGQRFKNVLHFDSILGKYSLLIKGKSNLADYQDPVKMEQALVESWNDEYPAVLRKEQLLIPNDLSDMDNASVYGVDLLTRPLSFDSTRFETQLNFSPDLLEEKNMLKLVINTHGFSLPAGADAILAFEQPFQGNWLNVSLANFTSPGLTQVQTLYIPLSDFMKDGSGLIPDEPSGILQIEIHGQGNYHVDINSINAFYVSPN